MKCHPTSKHKRLGYVTFVYCWNVQVCTCVKRARARAGYIQVYARIYIRITHQRPSRGPPPHHCACSRPPSGTWTWSAPTGRCSPESRIWWRYAPRSPPGAGTADSSGCCARTYLAGSASRGYVCTAASLARSGCRGISGTSGRADARPRQYATPRPAASTRASNTSFHIPATYGYDSGPLARDLHCAWLRQRHREYLVGITSSVVLNSSIEQRSSLTIKIDSKILSAISKFENLIF